MKNKIITLISILLLTFPSYAEENKKEEIVSTKGRFAVVFPPEIQYSFTDSTDLGLGFRIFNFLDTTRFLYRANFNIKHSLFRKDNIKYFISLGGNLTDSLDKKYYDSNFYTTSGFENFINKNISISADLGLNYNMYLYPENNKKNINNPSIQFPIYNIKASYYF